MHVSDSSYVLHFIIKLEIVSLDILKEITGGRTTLITVEMQLFASPVISFFIARFELIYVRRHQEQRSLIGNLFSRTLYFT